ncbi:PREDICTED: four-jointed box protein 1-like [Branchiostoma belcheri]|uniref:Four-jointed box protein 1-like n=1 Tax=Branchiostoma belcheri TaxID=7741 RepID=A0A6P4ZH97_BRABE|nr:PREDICTED: four-jointed box protein 1-like [Branchiostoma belcheri]
MYMSSRRKCLNLVWVGTIVALCLYLGNLALQRPTGALDRELQHPKLRAGKHKTEAPQMIRIIGLEGEEERTGEEKETVTNSLNEPERLDDPKDKPTEGFKPVQPQVPEVVIPKVPPKLDLQKPGGVTWVKANHKGVPVVEDGIYWARKIEGKIPSGHSVGTMHMKRHAMRHLPVEEVLQARYGGCGHGADRVLRLSDDSWLCARYRDPTTLQGEMLSFLLGRLLGMRNVPTVVLSQVNFTAIPEHLLFLLTAAGWQDKHIVGMVDWQGDFIETLFPHHILDDSETRLGTVSPMNRRMRLMSVSDLVALAQWSDLLVFDYILFNNDRLVRNLYLAQTNSTKYFHEPVKNVRRSGSNNGLWYTNNGDQLITSFSWLAGIAPSRGEVDYTIMKTLHEDLLKTTCLFRRETVLHIEKLYATRNAADILFKELREKEPHGKSLPPLPRDLDFGEVLQKRIDDVYLHFQRCRQAADLVMSQLKDTSSLVVKKDKRVKKNRHENL